MSVAYACQENRAGFQAGAAPNRAQEASSAKHQATAGASEADGLEGSVQAKHDGCDAEHQRGKGHNHNKRTGTDARFMSLNTMDLPPVALSNDAGAIGAAPFHFYVRYTSFLRIFSRWWELTESWVNGFSVS